MKKEDVKKAEKLIRGVIKEMKTMQSELCYCYPPDIPFYQGIENVLYSLNKGLSELRKIYKRGAKP